MHKATHHFDLLNWYLDSDPREVFARGALVITAQRPFRGVRCRTCPHADKCDYFFDIDARPLARRALRGPVAEDGYFRDACVFREDIDIFDTMSAAIRYENGVQVSYSLNTFMPIEGYHLAFNGMTAGSRSGSSRGSPGRCRDHDEILVNEFWPAERIRSRTERAATSAATRRFSEMLFARSARSARPARRRTCRRDVGAHRRRRGQQRQSGKPVEVMPLLFEEPA